ncbi:type II toxin-antitoxin system VapC family toxin [Cyanobacterium aponinum AL20118]|uniref:Type II toxin-antitoxin system VapC family toxin n=1 Tax=Cyanobacterium aponinum AL20115 TaxID=3090662 RepID=A0AAF0ZH45_9CHRO|nr:type II toxin-antitoxin system VapC family toxin [Cyanobacterium aponinum]WPF90102.1 type II toxin-antitoxin system VapC family toxin [Cyanobacterium aponinum AL20115]
MYILDTDHLSILERNGKDAEFLKLRLKNINPQEISVTIITYQEQLQGWLSLINKSNNIDEQINIYKRIKKQLINYCQIPIIDFDEKAGKEFQILRKKYPKIGTMDLKIASIVIVNRAILLTRNSRDFEKIQDLLIEDWTQKIN